MTHIASGTALLAQLREALEHTRQFGVRKLGAPSWEPAAGSEAAGEVANTEVDANAQPWGDQRPRTAYAAANLLMTGVLDNLGSLEYLLHEPTPRAGPHSSSAN